MVSATLVQTQDRLRLFLSAVIASVILGLAAPMSIYTPFSPVPFTLQVHLVFLFAALLPQRYALLMMGGFYAQIFMGLPVGAGAMPVSLLSPSLGYLVGYGIAAYYLTNAFSKEQSAIRALGHLCIANGLVYLCGVCFLQTFVGPINALQYGVVPFLAPDFCKNLAILPLLRILRG